SGEDAIAYSDADDYAANLEQAPALPPNEPRPPPRETLRAVATPGQRSIAEVSAFLGVAPQRCVKIMLVAASGGGVVAIALRGDHELNAVKAQRLPQVARPLRLATVEEVRAASGVEPGFVGPVNLPCPLYADHAAAQLADFVCGANRPDTHLCGVNWGRDIPEPRVADLRNVVAGDPSPSGRGRLRLTRGIEVGHVFQLGRKYSEAMRATVLDEAGQNVVLHMGCYGIGITRIVAAAIEQNHDSRGIIWPEPLAPFQIVLVPLNAHRSPRVQGVAERLYADLGAAGFEVLLDDRDARPGVKFADAELLGIPHRVVIGERSLDTGRLEYRHRRSNDDEEMPL
ncbi:MAG: proline--tRNA ligase, partial [Steroidobacteraceae bacterium]|nr:proline--tRNA ligase [Steroidobacteraceae bacterium]